MFKYSKITNIAEKFFNFFWPKMGFLRFFKYIFIKLKRIPERPHSIAAGFACGVLVSFTPCVGFHLILSAVLSFILKGSIVASFIGTIIGNPWTFPLIWLGTYRLGLFLMDIYRPEFEIQSVRFMHMFQNFFGALIQLDYNKFKVEIMPIWLPMLIGSMPLGIMSWIGTYFPLKKAIRRYQKHRAMARERKKLGIFKQKEIKNKLKNIYKKIKRVIRNQAKTKWHKNAKKRAYIKKLARRLRIITNQKHYYSYKHNRKRRTKISTNRFSKKLTSVKSGGYSKRLNKKHLKKLRRLIKK